MLPGRSNFARPYVSKIFTNCSVYSLGPSLFFSFACHFANYSVSAVIQFSYCLLVCHPNLETQYFNRRREKLFINEKYFYFERNFPPRKIDKNASFASASANFGE